MNSPARTGVVIALTVVPECSTAPLKMPGCTATRSTAAETCTSRRSGHCDDVCTERRFRRYVEVDLRIARVERPHIDAVEQHTGATQIDAEKGCQRTGSDPGGKRGRIHDSRNHRHRAARVQRQQRPRVPPPTESLSWLTAAAIRRPLETREIPCRIGRGDWQASRCRLLQQPQCAPRGKAIRSRRSTAPTRFLKGDC